MKQLTFLLALVFTFSTMDPAHAGGGACRFKTEGAPVLKQSPVLARLLAATFVVEDSGKMGPMDAPYDGGRLYTYMEFRASALGSEEQKHLVRLHFERGEGGRTLKSMEFLPQKTLRSPDGEKDVSEPPAAADESK